jgi:hypothetical protein
MRKIISLSGFKGSGKDTVGHIMCDRFEFQAVSFAQPLKQALSLMFGWDLQLLQGHSTQSREWRETVDPFWSKQFGRPITPRIVMQEFGTNVVRNHFLNKFWVASTQKLIENLPNTNIVVTDSRFIDELNMIRSLGGSCIRVQRGDNPSWFNKCAKINNHFIMKHAPTLFEPKLKSVHPSERNWIGYNFDYVIDNNSSLTHLEQQVISLYEQMKTT